MQMRVFFQEERKYLLISRIEFEKIPFDGISHQDVEVLHVSSEKEWKAEGVVPILSKIGKKRGISYIISDHECNLTMAYKLGQYVHIGDYTHILANFIKKFMNEIPSSRNLESQLECLEKMVSQ